MFLFLKIMTVQSSPVILAVHVTVTNKGISTIPNLTLGKPAAIFDMLDGKEKTQF